MKNCKIGIFLLLLTMVVFGCSDDDAGFVTPCLEVGEKILSFDESATQTLAVEANGHWKARVIKDSTEFIVSPTEGNGNGEVTITLNRSKVEHISGYLKVTYTDGTDEGLEVARGVKLVASKLDLEMEVIPRNVTFNSALKYVKQALQVNVNGKWMAGLSDTTWCSIDCHEGDGKGRIVLTLKDGVKMKEKSAELIVRPAAFPWVKYVVKIEERRGYTHGEHVVLNRASVGNGIDVVILGDFFTEEDLKAGGRWEQACNIFMQHFFAMEPFKSYRDCFNVYAVAYPNDRDLWYDSSESVTEEFETPFASYHAGNKNELYGGITSNRKQKEAAYSYAYEHSPVAREKGTLKNLIVGLAQNTNLERFAPVSWSNNVDKYETCGMVVTPLSMFGGDLYLFAHELLGHGFGDFHENYVTKSSEFEFDDKYTKEYYLNQQRGGIFQDTEFSKNPDEFINRAWAELYEMNYRNVGIFEGARLHLKGVWRSSSENTMRTHGTVYFSPVQRELILRKIYRLAGLEEEYSLQTFLDYDVINKEQDEAMMKKYAY